MLRQTNALRFLYSRPTAEHGFENVRPNVQANRHFAVGRFWARLLKPKIGLPQSVRLSDQLGRTLLYLRVSSRQAPKVTTQKFFKAIHSVLRYVAQCGLSNSIPCLQNLRGEAPAPSRDDEVRRHQKLRPNVLANRHFAVGRVWARLLKPKLGPPQSVRLSAS